jgi:hypothetical protein
MGQIRYRVYLDDDPATREQLDEVEDISVEQAIDAAWTARLRVPISTDEKGNWGGASKTFQSPFARVRVELDPGDGKFVVLIDGPIVGADRDMSSEPGQSMHTVLVYDDSVSLNRTERQFMFENKLDHEIAAQIYKDAEHVDSTDIATDTPPPAGGLPPKEIQRGTEMQILRRLATRQGMYAYVLPGKDPGASVGVFKSLPDKPDGLPPLILLGPDRNVASFAARQDSQSPATVEAQSLSITDKAVSRASASFRDVTLLGDKPAAASLAAAAKRLLPPGKDGSVDAKTAVRAAAQALAYSFTANGTVLGESYGAVLTPYRVVTVKGVDEKQSGDYVIKNVTHKLTRSVYEQSFGLMRNASSEAPSPSNLLGAIF